MNKSSKQSNVLKRPQLVLALMLSSVFSIATFAQQPPPELGQETKGVPAVDERSGLAVGDSDSTEQNLATDLRKGADEAEQSKSTSGIDNLLGKADVKESKRENGQVYLIELEHSSGAKQYIEETDSDGKIESTSNDIEETPNLPKWKLGSW